MCQTFFKLSRAFCILEIYCFFVICLYNFQLGHFFSYWLLNNFLALFYLSENNRGSIDFRRKVGYLTSESLFNIRNKIWTWAIRSAKLTIIWHQFFSMNTNFKNFGYLAKTSWNICARILLWYTFLEFWNAPYPIRQMLSGPWISAN